MDTLLTAIALVTRLAGDVAVQPELAQAMADEVSQPGGAFVPGDKTGAKTLALMSVWAWHESHFDNAALGDHGQSFCALQIMLGKGKSEEGWTGPELGADVRKCVHVAWRMMGQSFRACRSLPVAERGAVYASGHCSSAAGRRISRDRSGQAARLESAVAKELSQ